MESNDPAGSKLKRPLFAGTAAIFVLILTAGYFLLSRHNFRQYYRPPGDAGYRDIVNRFRTAQPAAVNVSPDGKYLLVKTEETNGFRISVLDRESKRVVASNLSKGTQRSLTWRPDSKAIAFQELLGKDQPMFILDIAGGAKTPVNCPISQTALPPIRWSPSGDKLAYFVGDWQTGRILVISPKKNDQPVVIRESISGSCDFVWSPDGSSLATSDEQGGTVTVTSLNDLHQTLNNIAQGEIHDLAWSPDGKFILVSAFAQDDEFFKLYQIETSTGNISVKAEANGDIGHPIWMPDSKAFVYHVNSNGITRAFLWNPASSQSRPIGPTNGVLRVTHADSGGQTLYAHFSGLTAPPVLGQISAADGSWKELYACPGADQCRCPDPEFLTITAADGVAIPAYHWAGVKKAGREGSVLIVAHGGARTQTYPTWEAYLNLVTGWGCDVIAVNHRGSSGYGRRFEVQQGEPVDDIVAACEYASNVLHVKPGRIFLTGISNGSGLIAHAAARGQEFGGLLLVSWPGRSAPDNSLFGNVHPVFEFHGEIDPLMSPEAARNSVETFFENRKQAQIPVQYYVFEGEGHFFYRTESKAAIYWELAKLLRPPG